MFRQRAGDFWVLCGGIFYHSSGYLQNHGFSGDFHRPYETLNVSHFTIQRTTLPQSRIRSTAPSEREPGTALPLTRPLKNRNVAGDFHRPYETQKILVFTIQRRTLSQSASLTAPSEREPGGTGGGKSQKCRQKPPGLFEGPGVKCVWGGVKPWRR